MALDGVELAVTSAQTFVIDGRQLAAGTAGQVSLNPDLTWQLTTRSSCSGAVTGSFRISNPTFNTAAAPGDTVSRMLTLCSPEARSYRGALTVVWDGALHTVNTLSMEDYLRGVVPREVPASWADAAGGRGINAVRAQAVAARSYAQSENRYGWAKTCDTTTCQVYGGAGLGGARIEDTRTDRAVSGTAGDVLILGGAVARAEFHSSSGGWTAGGTFPAVPDDGDVASPYHDWSTAVPRATVSSAFGVGPLQSITVLTRNGLGAEGGRVLTVRVTGTTRSVVVTGTDFRTALGLRSDWFSIGPVPPSYDPTRDDISPVGVAAARTDLGTVLAFVRGTNGAVWTTTARNGTFGGFREIPSVIRGGPAAVSADGRRVDLFVTGADRALWHSSTVVDGLGQPTTFTPWESLGGILTTGPAAASSAAGRLIVSARGTDGAVWSRTLDGSTWSAWQSAGGLGISAPAVDVVGAGTYRVLVVGVDGAVWSRQLSAAGGTGTSDWTSGGLHSTFAPGASGTASWARSIRAVAYNNGPGVREIWGASLVVDIGGIVTSSVALVEWDGSSVWALARGADNQLWLNVVTDSGGSSTWSRVGGILA
jgi:SpoIID/LytB domain protein